MYYYFLGVARCNCIIGQRSCRQCSAYLYSDANLNHLRHHSSSYQGSSIPEYQKPFQQQHQLLRSPKQPYSLPDSFIKEYQPPKIYLPSSALSNDIKNGPVESLYPSQEYEQMIFGSDKMSLQTEQKLQPKISAATFHRIKSVPRPTVSDLNQNFIIDSVSTQDEKTLSDKSMIPKTLKFDVEELVPFSSPPSDVQNPSAFAYSKPSNFDLSAKSTAISSPILSRPIYPSPTAYSPSFNPVPIPAYSPPQTSLPSPPSEYPCPHKSNENSQDDCTKAKMKSEMKKKSETALALSFIGPTVSAAGLAVGLINFFRPNPAIPAIEKLREDIFARFDKIDQAIAANLGATTVQSDFFSEVEVKMNSLRKHHELYLTEANEAQTDSFKNICKDPAYHPITLIGAAESFLSFKKMDLQLQNDQYSDESYEKIKALYRNIYDELIILYGYCEAVVNGPGDEARTAARTSIAEKMVKNVNILLDDLNQRRLLYLNTNENSTIAEGEGIL